jgi:CRISPR/Cas system-associated exonuclease Cas4 (RecB family)
MSPEMPLIRASEVGQYAYCARAWWLGQVKGVPGAHEGKMAAGKSLHLKHGRTVAAARRWRALAWVLSLAAAGLGILLLWILLQG